MPPISDLDIGDFGSDGRSPKSFNNNHLVFSNVELAAQGWTQTDRPDPKYLSGLGRLRDAPSHRVGDRSESASDIQMTDRAPDIYAKVGATMGVSGELVRQAQRLKEALGRDELERRINAGESVANMYAELVGDDRVGLFVKVPREIRERARKEAKELGWTTADFVTAALTQIFGELDAVEGELS